ncbi:MAG: imidazole glycerol phosphate synthase subunit HisH [Candidatus Manganitrophaceae bacterium]|nr:MAG: imidazole glycerol phosphate synthase subunit HisH [Candidatus Manganitrophaceae bacterium]
MKIVIVNYGSGNLRSVQKGFERAGYAAAVTSDPKAVSDASHLVKPITESIRSGKPYLGICLGLQILFTEGMEFGPHPGLDLVPGQVIRFPENELKVPHMGWNQIRIEKKNPVLEGIPDGAYFYFVHSYYGAPKKNEWVATTTDYGVRFPSAIAHENVFACQFHPEKSQKLGLQILANFAKLN